MYSTAVSVSPRLLYTVYIFRKKKKKKKKKRKKEKAIYLIPTHASKACPAYGSTFVLQCSMLQYLYNTVRIYTLTRSMYDIPIYCTLHIYGIITKVVVLKFLKKLDFPPCYIQNYVVHMYVCTYSTSM